jgi:hypothetical protein
MIADTVSGIEESISFGEGGDLLMWLCTHSSGDSAWKGSSPVSISNRVTPSE